MSCDAASHATICVCMIVKNEQHVIQRALRSVRPWIDYWIVCDTGSTDNTPGVVLETMAGVPGELHRSEWVSFGHNRTEVLALAKQKADYALLLDADMVANVHGDPRDLKTALRADAYHIRYEGPLDYSQIMLVSTRHDWRFKGTTHEYITSPTAGDAGVLPALTLTHFADGGMRGDKFERDITLLLQEQAQDPDNPRTLFYLAQSYRDLGRFEEALEWYERRAAIDDRGWNEEAFAAKLQAGRMRLLLGHEWPVVRDALLDAYVCRPSRLEPLHELARACRLRGDYAEGFLYSKAYEGHPYPTDRLFVDRAVHQYRLALEHGVCAEAMGAYEPALRAFRHVLQTGHPPDWVVDSAIRGTRLCLEAQRARRVVRDAAQPSAATASAPVSLAVVIPFHNPGHFLDTCVDSLLAQDYPHVRFLFLDDSSDDGSGSAVPRWDTRVEYYRQPRRRGATYGLHAAITRWCAADEVIVVIDGDDWLRRSDALSRIADAYRDDPSCWLLYGQYETSRGEYGLCRPFESRAAFARLREDWRTSHVKTFRAGLFHRIAEQDPAYACLKDADEDWLRTSIDVALMYPLLELAGYDHVRFNDEVLYVYNVENPRSVHRLDYDTQTRTFRDLQRRPRFAPVESWSGAPDLVPAS